MDTIKSKRVYRFAEEYAKDRNGTQAAIRAGYSRATAGEQAARLLADDRIKALVQEACERVSRDVVFEAADVLREWVTIATADPAKVSQVRHLNCRHCWGTGHEYQWTPREYAKACDAAAAATDKMGNPKPRNPPDCTGGFGWVFNAEPNAECPECRGEGVRDIWIADFDTLEPAERKLIAGLRYTKDGVEVKMRDQENAVTHIAKYLGMLIEKKELTGKNGGPLVATTIPMDLPGDAKALAALYAQIVGE